MILIDILKKSGDPSDPILFINASGMNYAYIQSLQIKPYYISMDLR